MKQTKVFTRVSHVNGWSPAIYMTYTSENFRLFHVSNLSVLSFRFFCPCIRGPRRAPRRTQTGKRADQLRPNLSPGHSGPHRRRTKRRKVSAETGYACDLSPFRVRALHLGGGPRECRSGRRTPCREVALCRDGRRVSSFLGSGRLADCQVTRGGGHDEVER